MTGNNRSARVLVTDRDRGLLAVLAMMRYLDRELAAEVMGCAEAAVSTTNARLLKLCRAGYLGRLRLANSQAGAKAVYFLTKRGSELISHDGPLVQRRNGARVLLDPFIEHRLAVARLYASAACRPIFPKDVRFKHWRAFAKPMSRAIPLLPDGYFEVTSPTGIHAFFVEVDLGTETSKVWKRKVQLYLQLALSGDFQQLSGQSRFMVLVVTDSERRNTSLRKLVARQTDKIFRFSTFSNINQQSLFAAHWLRPTGDEQLSLL